MSYQDDVDFLRERIDILMWTAVHSAAEKAGLIEDPTTESVADLYEKLGGSIHAILVLTHADPPPPEDHLQFRWFKVEGGKVVDSDERSRLEHCDCDHCAEV